MRRLPSEPEYFRERRLIREKIKRDKFYFVYFCAVLFVSAVCLIVLFFKTSPLIDKIQNKLNDVDCKVSFVGFEHGDSIYIECEGKNALIDSGSSAHGDELMRYLKNNNIEKLDNYFVSELNEGYVQIFTDVLKSIEAVSFILPAENDDAAYKEIDDLIFTQGKFPGNANKGYFLGVNQLLVNVIDEDSVSLKISFGENEILIWNCNDEVKEHDFLNSNKVSDVDVLRIKNGIIPSAEFIDSVKPETIIVDGDKDVYSGLTDSSVNILSLDSCGEITVLSDEVDIVIRTE